MSASFVAVLILMKVLEICAIALIPVGVTRLVGVFNKDVRDMFISATPAEYLMIWLLGVLFMLLIGIIIVSIIGLLHINITWLTPLLG